MVDWSIIFNIIGAFGLKIGKGREGPKVLISNVDMEGAWIERENMCPTCRFKMVFRNVGEHSTLMEVTLKLTVKSPENSFTYWGMTYKQPLHPDQIHTKALYVDFADSKAEGWTNGILEILGYYMDQKNREKKIYYIFEGTSELNSKWTEVKKRKKKQLKKFVSNS
ncbi:MAG: hypothetical protein ACTSQE_09975 [Candidatus Heimdallarchaeaceae archaeon]